jgi:hypothetical protein
MAVEMACPVDVERVERPTVRVETDCPRIVLKEEMLS